ncbi:MAG: imidazolonepropionase [Gammaproteobacteria bacterium]
MSACASRPILQNDALYDLLIHNARIHDPATGLPALAAPTIAVHDGSIAAVGCDASAAARRRVDAGGRVLLPGFIDCHTHAVYAGDRMVEHAQRLAGVPYAEIARAGGGIMNTVRAVRAATHDQLVAASLPRVRALAAEGVTTLEVKSGYGLDHDNELKMLRAIRDIGERVPLTIVPTFLGAHTVPPKTDRAAYLDTLIERTLPVVAAERLAAAVDIYVEGIAFTADEMERLFAAAAAHGLGVKVHAEQLSDIGATRRAAAFRPLSADHLEWIDADGVRALAGCGAIAVLLPGAWYCLQDTRKPPVALLREHGVPLAVATDLNPGTSPVASLLAAMHLAAHAFGLTPNEVLRGVTVNAARALGLSDRGTLAPGQRADLCLWDIPAPEFLLYQLGGIAPPRTFINGVET